MHYRWLPTLVILPVLAAAGLAARAWIAGAPVDNAASGTSASPTRVPIPVVRFTDITEAAGITFRHTNGAFGKKLLPETMGSGVAFLDYDG
ncbi:MAG TPA: hypothetical protein VKI17_03665, partial [Gemmataceae bacterium]|nr:hypothetical protein [Gemmataceae bacterium]